MTATLQTTNIQNAASSTTNLALDTSGNVTVGSSLTAANNITATSGTVVMASSFLRNRIINGGMVIDQRNAGASQSFTASTNTYSVDRWFVSVSTGTTGQRVAGTLSQYRYQLTGASGTTVQYFNQRIESYNIYDLANQTVTLSVNLSNSLLTSVGWQIYYPTATDNYTSVTSGPNGSFTVNSTETKYTVSFTLGSAAVNGVQVQFFVGSQTSGTWTIGNVQLEPGSVATPFERRLYGQELVLCQRYYFRTAGYNLGVSTNSTDGYNSVLTFPTTMRVVPTLDSGTNTYFVASGSAGTVAISTTSRSPGSVGSTNSVQLYNSASNWSSGTLISVNAGFTAEL